MEVTFVGSTRFPRTSGLVELLSPSLDVPLKEARWEVFLPPDYTYTSFQGTMVYESADLVAIEQEFTFAEYQRQEISQQQTFETQAIGLLSKAKSELAAGNYENASKLGQYRQSRTLRGSNAGQELAAVEEQMKEAQSSNLINANRSFAEENERRLNIGVIQSEGKTAAGAAYDKKVAEQQVAQLQKAQAVAVTRVTPLRVNLPTRGLRHGFVQVLQTEVNKPLSVRFTASNDRRSGWLISAARWIGAGLTLWLLAAVALLFRSNPEPATKEPARH